ncbi:hypothetical protein [Streptomyces sp. WM6378]|uniref:hypothetical protein n=1 Tax=Streptomyces sp. WM6378 TaxID=1415557 RepID=UPI0006B05EEE|nr:hypothetical protein [Streptomyces sp. WM6378]
MPSGRSAWDHNPDPHADKLTRHAWATLREQGNLGGVAVMAVLSRTHDDPPADGARGLLLGFGPGFVAAAATATWLA